MDEKFISDYETKKVDNICKRDTKTYEIFIGEYYMLRRLEKALWEKWLFK